MQPRFQKKSNFLISILKLEQDGDEIPFLWGSAAIKRQNKKVEHVLWISYMAQLSANDVIPYIFINFMRRRVISLWMSVQIKCVPLWLLLLFSFDGSVGKSVNKLEWQADPMCAAPKGLWADLDAAIGRIGSRLDCSHIHQQCHQIQRQIQLSALSKKMA